MEVARAEVPPRKGGGRSTASPEEGGSPGERCSLQICYSNSTDRFTASRRFSSGVIRSSCSGVRAS
jgi:hypothetical protein